MDHRITACLIYSNGETNTFGATRQEAVEKFATAFADFILGKSKWLPKQLINTETNEEIASLNYLGH